ncbi:ADP-heptose:LPS heptosyltransferase [Duganella sp. 1411]|uniref:glycosyltransferase family 9 protein n=1 Tax=Duganella sp. 1411 TaxID=2806572 RepID=UPI001AEAC2A2|nr:glycosyltransferase family 9 protein [Duganella sp. 1411]MBP1203339.1 ADP-heptose:LPS heptosyltransferase [Duganella sp. 1411]
MPTPAAPASRSVPPAAPTAETLGASLPARHPAPLPSLAQAGNVPTPQTQVEPSASLLPDVRHIVVLRPNAIGDYIFALPALHALRASYPAARITLLGKPWHAGFLHGRPGPVSDVIAMPPLPGIGAAPDAPMPESARQLVAALRNMRIDVALQMYGGGAYSNAFVASLGAAVSIGATTPGAPELDRTIVYSRLANRRVELLQIAALAGARPHLVSPELEVTAADRALAAQILPGLAGARMVVVHPGASDPRRRWPPAAFAAVADVLADAGAQIVISATDSEADTARAVVGHMRHRPVDLTGRLPLPALCGLLDRARLIVSNDTGPLHLALALNKPAVGIFWLTNMIESCPLAQHLLRPALSTRIHCPVCGEENLHTRCPHDASFVADVGQDEVIALALELFRDTK